MTPNDHTHGTGDPPVIAMRLLDGFELLLGDDPVPVVPSSQRLLAYLALRAGSVPRQTVAAVLWPTATAQRAAACLRSALWRLVRPPFPLVEAGKERLRLGSAVDVDVATVHEFVAERAPLAPSVSLPALTADLLPGWTDRWVIAERDWCRQVCLRALEMLSERFRASGDNFRAHETAAAAVRGDPLRESAHRRLIELHLADGNPAAALRQYSAYQTLLRTELGVSPSPEIRRLVAPMFTD